VATEQVASLAKPRLWAALEKECRKLGWGELQLTVRVVAGKAETLLMSKVLKSIKEETAGKGDELVL